MMQQQENSPGWFITYEQENTSIDVQTNPSWHWSSGQTTSMPSELHWDIEAYSCLNLVCLVMPYISHYYQCIDIYAARFYVHLN